MIKKLKQENSFMDVQLSSLEDSDAELKARVNKLCEEKSEQADKIRFLESLLEEKDRAIKNKNRQLEKTTFRRDRHLQCEMNNGSALVNLWMNKPPPKPISVKCVMFAYTGLPIREDALTRVFQNVSAGYLDANLKYCVANLFEQRPSDTLAELVAKYNWDVGVNWAIELVAVDGLPPIFGREQHPSNRIKMKCDDDFMAEPNGYRTWVNEPPPKPRNRGR